MSSKRDKITIPVVEGAPIPPTGGETRVWDTETKGLFLRVLPGGTRTFALKYRVGRTQRIYKLGNYSSAFKVKEAREGAEAALREVSQGRDPADAKREAREALTVGQLIEAYLTEGPPTKPAKRASSWANDKSNLRRHIQPLLGSKVADAVTKADAGRAIQAIRAGRTAVVEKTGPRGKAVVTGGESAASHAKAVAAAMFAWGVEHGKVKQNPFAGIRLARPATRERFLTREEAGKLLDALAAMQAAGEVTNAVADVIRVLMLTGARKTEIAALTWREVDFERRCLVLPPERTKAGGRNGERRIRLAPAALSILTARRPGKPVHNAPVFPSTRTKSGADGGPVESAVVLIRRPFMLACERAGIHGVRLHDLRHSFASFAIADGVSLFMVSKLLGHASPRTTEIYSHLAGDTLDDAAAAATRGLFPNSSNKAGAEIVNFRKGA
jgi:integrase